MWYNIKMDSFKTRQFSRREIIIFVSQWILFALDVFLCATNHFFSLSTEAVANIVMEMFGMVICGFLYFSVLIDDRKSKFRDLFLFMIFHECLILFLDSTTWFMQFKPQFTLLLKIVNCLFFVLGTEIITLFWNTQVEIMNLKSRAKKPLFVVIQILALVQIIATFLNVFFGYFYTIENANFITNKTTGNLQYIYSMIIFIVSLYFAITTKTSMKIKAPFIAINILPLCVSILQLFHYTLSFMYISVLAALIILYVNIQVDMGHRIEEFKNKVMISQIQPHFMYNTLTTIKALCRVEPDLAAKTITNFADYLRGNMDFASLETTIPFEKELNHTRIYTEIEALRFDNIKFEFQIEDIDFEIPALTVQPMVENAVRHGVRSKPDAHILIHTYAEENYHVVVIKDNGKGFDHAQFNGSRTHIGLLNTRLRVERLVNGKFSAESIPGQGVTITIKIPRIIQKIEQGEQTKQNEQGGQS